MSDCSMADRVYDQSSRMFLFVADDEDRLRALAYLQLQLGLFSIAPARSRRGLGRRRGPSGLTVFRPKNRLRSCRIPCFQSVLSPLIKTEHRDRPLTVGYYTYIRLSPRLIAQLESTPSVQAQYALGRSSHCAGGCSLG